MIDFIFTVDYEIYGNGSGSLKELVYDPTQRLMRIFQQHDARFVAFIEAAEFQRIEARHADQTIAHIGHQIRSLYERGFEIGLHLHPQWCNAQYRNGCWDLDYSEYNLCTLTRSRISEIVGTSIGYISHLLNDSSFKPLSFRAGNWLFQPTRLASEILADHGLRIDSSVFKGGVIRRYGVDYRPARMNGYYWQFHEDVTTPDENGRWTEVPIYSKMVAPWKIVTAKPGHLEKELRRSGSGLLDKIRRGRDMVRLACPLKLDFCRLDLVTLTSMIDDVIREDSKAPEVYRPIVSIGHTKDFHDSETLNGLLRYLDSKRIEICTFPAVFSRLAPSRPALLSRRQ